MAFGERHGFVAGQRAEQRGKPGEAQAFGQQFAVAGAAGEIRDHPGDAQAQIPVAKTPDQWSDGAGETARVDGQQHRQLQQLRKLGAAARR